MSGLLGLKGVSREEILEILDLAEEFVDSDDRIITPPVYRDSLRDKVVGLLFFEPSTRTRASFELAVNRLGGYPMQLNSEVSSIRKGETELDTVMNLVAMGVDGFVIRHPERHVPLSIADRVGVPVINAGNGTGEHPTQALLDCFALRRSLGRKDLEGVTVAIIGDVVHSRVARSDCFALRALGADVLLAGPPKLLPVQNTEGWDARLVETRAEALRDADAVIMLRIQTERIHGAVVDTDTYVRDWGLDDSVVETEMKPDAVIMHPGPVIRGIELSTQVADSARSLILQQAAYGVAIRQAILLREIART